MMEREVEYSLIGVKMHHRLLRTPPHIIVLSCIVEGEQRVILEETIYIRIQILHRMIHSISPNNFSDL